MIRDGTDGTNCVDLTLVRAGKNRQMRHPQIRALLEYWDRLRAGRRVPYRAEVDPRDMECDARNLFILEDLGQGNIRFRLAGTALVDAFGMELRGMSARSIMEGRARESFTQLIAEALAEPGVGYARIAESAGEAAPWEVLLLPMRSDFGRTDRVLGALLPLGPEEGLRRAGHLRFLIEEMSIRPVSGSERAAEPSMPAMGFAEAATPFIRRPDPETGARLHAIEGGRSEEQAEDAPAPRRRAGGAPHLRLVKDD